MNYLTFLLRAQNQYNLHSPYVYDLYMNVLAVRSRRDFATLARSLEEWLAPDAVERQSDSIKLTKGHQELFLVARPHASHEAEQQWRALKEAPRYEVSIDLFHAGLLIHNAKLHRQQFLLR